MACDAQSVATESAAFLSQPDKYLLGMQVYLLAQWAKQLNPALDVTPQALMNGASCYVCDMSGKWLMGAMVYLLCLIQAGVGGAAVVTNGPGDPPIDGSVPTLIYRNTLNDQKFLNVGTVAVPNWQAI